MKELMIFIAALTAILLTACGGGGGGITIAMQTCLDGSVIPQSEVCTKTCLDGSTVPELSICEKTCLDGSTVSELSTCEKTCPDGSRIYEEFSCRIRCDDGTTVFEPRTCFRCMDGLTSSHEGFCEKICEDGSRIEETATCMQTCGNGDVIPETDSCEFLTQEYGRNYGLGNMNAAAAYSAGYFGQGVTVAVVDAGVRISHQDLRDNIVEGRDFVEPSREVEDRSGHGTAVAGIIAAKRGGNLQSSHGVAPEASLMGLKIGDYEGDLIGNELQAFRHAATTGVHIVNNSYGRSYILTGNYRGTQYHARIPDRFEPSFNLANWRLYTRTLLNEIKNSDIVLVWSAGNQGWQHISGEIDLCSDVAKPRFISECETAITTVAQADFINEFVNAERDEFSSFPTPGRYNRLPYYAAAANAYEDWLIGDSTALFADENYLAITERWLSVVALDINNEIASYSNGCGSARFWCLAAPATGTYTTSGTADDLYRRFSGTSAAAPHASGALAVIRSVIPDLQMSVARLILLRTATDLGAFGIDSVYGHGLINLEAAVNAAINLQTPSIAGLAAIPFAALRQELPARYDYLPNRLQGVSVAIQITDDSYYNVGLSDMISAEEQESDIGDGAAEILRPAATDSPPGFFAYGDINSQIGMRYVGNISGVSFMSDIRHTATDTDFVGGDLGVLGAIDGKSNAGEIQFRRYLGDNFAVFGGYEYLDINATADEGHLISAIDNVRADGYNVGFSFGNLWRFGDQFSLSAKQKTALSDGELTIRYPHAIGNLHAAFYGNRQNIEIHEATISLRQKTPLILTAGYRQPLNAKSEWAAALEYNAGNNAKALSLIWQGEF